MTSGFKWAFIVLAAGIYSPGAAYSLVSFGGYSKAFAVASWPPKIEGLAASPVAWSIHDALRLKLAWSPAEAVSLNLAWGIVPRVGNPSAEPDQYPSARRYRVDDIRQGIYPWKDMGGEHFTVQHNIDRAYLRMSRGPADIFIGRQAVAWGSARAVNPTDVIAPYPFTELDAEERVGVDALRAVLQLGGLSFAEAGVVAGRGFSPDSSAAFLRAKTHWALTDIAPCIALYRGHFMSGLDLAGSLGGAGAWLEAAYTKYDAKGLGGPGGGDSWRLSVGCDSRLSNAIFTSIEYHFNGDGQTDPAGYTLNASKPGYLDGPVYLMGRHYLIPSISWQLHPLVSASTSPFVNLRDHSILLAQNLECSVSQDSHLSAGAYIPLGERQRLEEGSLSNGSEYGDFPIILHLSYGIYF